MMHIIAAKAVALKEASTEEFRRYQAHTRTTAEHYIGELLAKTRPTLQAMVEALDEADGDAQALGRLFGSKMAQLMQAQQTVQAEA